MAHLPLPPLLSPRGADRSRTGRPTRSRHDEHERGAALVEFALVLPILALLIFGTIEFGWAFSQKLDVRHGAREAGRLFVVDFDDGDPATSTAEGIVAEVCRRMDDNQPTTVTVTTAAGGLAGSYATVRLTRSHNSLTGFMDFALPTSLDSEVEMRIEQDASWTSGSYGCP